MMIFYKMPWLCLIDYILIKPLKESVKIDFAYRNISLMMCSEKYSKIGKIRFYNIELLLQKSISVQDGS